MAGRGIIWQLPKRKLNTRSTYFGGLAPLKVGASELLSFVRVDFAHEAVQGLKCPSFPKPCNGTRSSYHHTSFASNSLRQSTDNLSRSYNVRRGGSSSNIWGLRWRCGFHSQSFHKSHWFSPLSTSTRYVGRSCSFFDIQRCYSSASREQKSSTCDRKSQRMLLYLVALVFAMVGSSYAAVPLYRRFCQATGYGGTVQRRESVEEKIARHTRDGTMTTRMWALLALKDKVMEFGKIRIVSVGF